MTGIQRAGNTGYDITFRGFKTSGNDRNAILTDGLPGLSVRFGSPPTIGTDHIELVKGATSVLYGQAQPGGFINIITKKPLAHSAYQVELKAFIGAGPFSRQNGYLPSVDFTGPITESRSLLYRVVAEAGYSRGFRDGSNDQPIYIAPSLTWKPGQRTDITHEGEYRRDKTHYDTYLVAPNRDVSLIAPINTVYQEPNDYLLERGYVGTLLVKHDFTDKIVFNLGYRYVDHFDTQQDFDVNGFKTGALLTTLTRRAGARKTSVRTASSTPTSISSSRRSVSAIRCWPAVAAARKPPASTEPGSTIASRRPAPHSMSPSTNLCLPSRLL